MRDTRAVLLMAYGTPAGPDDITSYYTHIRGGRPPTPEQLRELTRRYRAIGGHSPLLRIARRQAAGLERILGLPVVIGMKHSPPFLEDAVASLAGRGAEQVLAMVLAPHYSALSVGQYITRVRAAAAAHARLEVSFVAHWHLSPAYLELLAERVHTALTRFPSDGRAGVHVVFTAHSLPLRIVADGDPYPSQMEETAAAVARLAGLDSWSVAWQSAALTPEPWIGPDVRDVVRDLAADGHAGVVVCPAGFVCDHLEVLYDLDIDCRQVAEQAGLRYVRTTSLNADPAFLAALAGVVETGPQVSLT